MQQQEQLEVWEHIQHLEEPTLHLEERPVLGTLVHLEVDTLVHLEQATQLQDLVIQLQGQATQHILSPATQHSLEVILLSLPIHLLQAAILPADQEVILLLLGPILLLQGLIPLLLEVTHPHLALPIPLSDIVNASDCLFVVIRKPRGAVSNVLPYRRLQPLVCSLLVANGAS